MIKNIHFRIQYLVFSIIIGLIVVWQLTLVSKSNVPEKYSRQDGSALILEQAKPFTYFHYYKNLYPVRTTASAPEYSVQGVDKIIKEKPDLIFNDNSYYIVWGDHGKEWLLLASAYLKGTPEKLSIIPVNSILFIFSLGLLFSAFAMQKRWFMGLIFVIILGSHPFQVYEVYQKENIFGIGITIMILLLAINLHLIFNNKLPPKFLYIPSLFSALILGTLTHIRMEYTSLALSCIFIYLLSNYKLKEKFISLLIFTLVVVSTSLVIKAYFDYKIEQAVKFVSKINNNHDLDLNYRRNYHTIWHPILIGLGDFDNKYGSEWSDHMAYKLARPILKERYPDRYQKMEPGEFMSVQPEYHAVIKEVVLSRIKNDPKWYLNIIRKRILKSLKAGTPVSLNLGKVQFNINFLPWYAFLLGIYLVIKKKWPYFKLIVFAMPLSASIILIHSLYGITNMTIYHHIALALLVSAFLQLILLKLFNFLKVHIKKVNLIKYNQ